MRTISARHRIYLLYRQDRAEESMISFIRDKLIRKGCLVDQDVTRSTTVLVLLTPGVFEFIDDPTDRVRNELLYVLRRFDEFRVYAILCDLFKWPDSIHLPEEIHSLKSCASIEWSPDNRNAFMRCLLELIDPSLLDVMSCPTSPQIIHEGDETIWNGGEGRNGVSTRAQNEEEVDGGLRRTGSAFYFDELNAHVERKSEVLIGRKHKPKTSEFPALGTSNDEGRLEETSDDTDIEESYTMEAYRPPELPDNGRSSAAPENDPRAYRPPELPRGENTSSPGSDDSEHAIAPREVPIFDEEQPDSYGVSQGRRERADSYEPPELPLDDENGANTEDHIRQTPSPGSRTATIRPRSGDKTSIYVPPPTPPPLVNSENGRDEADLHAEAPRSSQGSEPHSGTTTVVIEEQDRDRAQDLRRGMERENENVSRPDRESRPRPQQRPQSQPLPRNQPERGVDAIVPEQNFVRKGRSTGSTGSSTGSKQRNGASVERRSSIAKFFHRKTFKLPKDSEIRYGRYADEHPYWNAGSYKKLNLMDEFCDESYFANKRNTFPRTSIRHSNRQSSRPKYSEPEQPDEARSRRAASVVVLDETDIRNYVPEVEMISDEPTEDLEARKKDAGSTPKSERKTYDTAEEYRPPPVPEVIEAPVVASVSEDDIPTPAVETYEAPPLPQPYEEPVVSTADPPTRAAQEYAPPKEPQFVQEPLATQESPSTNDAEKYCPPEEPEIVEENSAGLGENTGSVPQYSPPPYDIDVQVVPEYVVLPAPRKQLLLNHAQIGDSVPLEKVEPLPDQSTYTQQIMLPRRFPPILRASEVKTTVPDIRMAAAWTQVEVDNVRDKTPSIKEGTAVGEYKPPPLPTEIEQTLPQESRPPEETVKTVPAVIRRYKPPELPTESASKTEPIAHREPEVRLRAEPRAHLVPKVDIESKLEPIAHHDARQIPSPEPEAMASYEPPPLPHETGSNVTQNRDNAVIHKSEPIAFKEGYFSEKIVTSEEMPRIVTRKNEPILRSATTTTDVPDGASFSKQNTQTEPSAHTSMDTSRGSTVVEETRVVRPIIFKRIVHPGDEVPFTPPNSYSEPTIHNNIARPQAPTPELPTERDPVPISPKVIYRKPAIPLEFSKSLITPDDSYQPPPMPITSIPEATLVRENSVLEERRKAAPVAHRTRPEGTGPPSKPTTTTEYYQPPPVPLNEQIEDKDKTRSPDVERKAQSVAGEQAPRPKQEPVHVPPQEPVYVAPQEPVYVALQEPVYVASQEPVYVARQEPVYVTPQVPVYVAPQEPVQVPPQVPNARDEYNERKGSPVAYIRPPPPPYKQNTSNDGDDEEEEAEANAKMERQKPVKGSDIRLREKEPVAFAHDPSGRRTRSVIEVSQSTMEPVQRRRVNSLDPRLTRDLREYVERHVCNKGCCKVVCPRRLAENIDNLHYADDVRILTNLDVLGRRRLSYLLAVEAQRYVSYLDSKFISAAGTDEGSKTPDSGCDPSSKVSEVDSDATLSDGEFVSEETVARELAKIEKIRQRNAQFQENGVIPPPRGFDGADRHRIYDSAKRKNNAKQSMQPYQVPPIPNEQTEYRPPQLPAESSASAKPIRDNENAVAYKAPEIPSGYESPSGLPSNPAAREAMKNIIEGRTVFEPHARKPKSSHEQRESDAKEAYNTWHSIWRNVKREEIPALTGHEILSLFGVMRHILGTKSSLPEVRDDLRTIIRKNGMGLKR